MIPTQRAMRSALRAAPYDAARGAGWYPAALAACERLAGQTGHDVATVVRVVAATSPRLRWSRNLTVARDLLMGQPFPGGMLGRSWINGHAVLDGAPLTGEKVRRFAANIMGATEPVTVDVWALRAARVDGDHLTPRQYGEVERAYQAVAHERGLTPRDYQAAVWVAATHHDGRRVCVPDWGRFDAHVLP